MNHYAVSPVEPVMTDPLDALMHPVSPDKETIDEVIVVAPPNATLGGSTASIGLTPGAFGAVPFAAVVHTGNDDAGHPSDDEDRACNDNTGHH